MRTIRTILYREIRSLAAKRQERLVERLGLGQDVDHSGRVLEQRPDHVGVEGLRHVDAPIGDAIVLGSRRLKALQPLLLLVPGDDGWSEIDV